MPFTIEGQLVSGLKSFFNQVNPWNLVEGTANLTYHPIETAKGYGATNQRLFNSARDAFARGDVDEGVRHGLYYLLNGIPGLGSTLDDAGNRAAAGDIGGGIGTGLGLGVNAAVGVRPGLIGEAASGVASAAKTAATTARTHAGPVVLGAGTHAILESMGVPRGTAMELSMLAGASAHRGVRGYLREALDLLKARKAPTAEPPVTSPPAAAPAAPAPARASRPPAPAETSTATPARARGAGRPSAPPPTPDAVAPTLTRAELTPEEVNALNEYIQHGHPEPLVLQLIEEFRQGRLPEQQAAVPAPRGATSSSLSTPTTRTLTVKEQRAQAARQAQAEKPKLSVAEGREYQRLRKFGNSHEQAMELIESQRAMLQRMGLETPEEVRRAVADRNRTGRWQDEP